MTLNASRGLLGPVDIVEHDPEVHEPQLSGLERILADAKAMFPEVAE